MPPATREEWSQAAGPPSPLWGGPAAPLRGPRMTTVWGQSGVVSPLTRPATGRFGARGADDCAGTALSPCSTSGYVCTKSTQTDLLSGCLWGKLSLKALLRRGLEPRHISGRRPGSKRMRLRIGTGRQRRRQCNFAVKRANRNVRRPSCAVQRGPLPLLSATVSGAPGHAGFGRPVVYLQWTRVLVRRGGAL